MRLGKMNKLNSSAQERSKTLQMGKGKPLDGILDFWKFVWGNWDAKVKGHEEK